MVSLRNHKLLARPIISIALVAVMLLMTLGVIFYVQKTLLEIEEALPITLSQQERDIRMLVNEMGRLVNSIEFARASQSPVEVRIVFRQTGEIEKNLVNIRDHHRFNDVLGVSSIHAILNPAIYDIRNWLSDGIHNFEPTSAQTLKMVEMRARQAYDEAESLLSQVGQTATDVLTVQAGRIQEFRAIMILTLFALTLMTVGLVILGFRLQRIVLALRESEEKIRYRANYDGLTHLPNRTNFIEHLTEAITRSHRFPGKTALLFIDLDRFKTVNDTLGHDVGDELIKQVATRICKAVRETDIVSRLGGDEFTVLLPDLHDELHASVVAKAILARLSEPFILDGHEIYSSASIGITISPQDGDQAPTLLKNADMAMYEAKYQGRNTFRYFTSQMTDRARQFLKLDKEMRQALAQDELEVYYQPIYELSARRMVGVEALLRWQHPTKGLILPEDFIGVAEETGLIEDIGMWVLRRACSDAVSWLGDEVPDNFYLAVNISMRQFKGGFDRGQVSLVLAETGFPAKSLVLEITESLLMENDRRIRNELADLRDMGVRLAVDDFGTGYSALSYLRDFPVNTLKIDRSFIHELASNRSDRRLVEAIITMAHGLELGIIAEGVETSAQGGILGELHCDMVQGNYYSEPLDTSAVQSLIHAGSGLLRAVPSA